MFLNVLWRYLLSTLSENLLPAISLTLWYSFSTSLSFFALPDDDFISLCFGMSFFYLSSLVLIKSKFLLHICIIFVIYSRCLAPPPHSVWVILPRAVPWYSALTLWTIPLSEPGSLSVHVPSATQPRTLPIASAPTLAMSSTQAFALTIVQAPKNASPSFMLHYQPNQ